MNAASNEEVIDVISKWLGTGSINIFGMQFSGKDTQGESLAKLFNAPLVGGGEILRNSVISDDIQNALDKGLYIDSDDYVNIITPYLSSSEFTGKPLILSSVGRWIGEENAILTATEAANHTIKAVLHLNITEAIAFERLKKSNRGRTDDHYENVASRITEFKHKTIPVLNVYKELGLLITVDGSKSPQAVLENILEELYKKAR